MPEASTSVIIDVPPKKIYEIVTDFEGYAEFLPEIREAEVLSKSTKKAQARFTIKVIKTIHYTLDYKLTPHKKIVWSFVEGNLFKDCWGSWVFKELKKGVTEATYTVGIDFGLFVPGAITKMLVGSNLPTMMQQFKKRAEGL